MRDAKVKELGAKVKEFEPFGERDIPNAAASSRLVLTCKIVNGRKCIKACLVAKLRQGPDLEDGKVDASGCVSLRSSNLQVILLRAIKRGKTWSPDTRTALLQAAGPRRGAFWRDSTEWDPSNVRRIWRLRAPAYGLDDAPVAFHRSLRKYLSNFLDSLAKVG